MSEACEALGIPVIGGNVSLLQRVERRRHPPDAGRRRARPDRRARAARRPARGSHAGDVDRRARRDARRSSAVRSGPRSCTASTAACRPRPTSTRRARLHELVAELVREREVAGVHDVSDGGLAVALCEMAFGGGTGFRVDLLTAPGARSCTPGRGRVRRVDVRVVVVAVAPEQVAAVLGAAVGGRGARRGDRSGGRRPLHRRRRVRRAARRRRTTPGATPSPTSWRPDATTTSGRRPPVTPSRVSTGPPICTWRGRVRRGRGPRARRRPRRPTRRACGPAVSIRISGSSGRLVRDRTRR